MPFIVSGTLSSPRLVASSSRVITADAMGIAPLLCEAAALPARLEQLAANGITEVAFQPMGDIERELRAFAAAAGAVG